MTEIAKGSLELSKDLNVITAEINAYQRVAGEAIFEIGKRLKHVKENDLAHGEWAKWCSERIGMTRQQADKFIVVFEELGGNDNPNCQIGITRLYHIATLPPEQREVEHELTSGQTKKPEAMTVRELREVKKALKEAQYAREQAESQAEQALKRAEQAERREPDVKIVEKTVEIDRTDYEALDRLRRYEEKWGDIDNHEYRIDTSTEINGTALEFSSAVTDLLKSYSYLQNYETVFYGMNGISREEYEKSLDALISFATSVRRSIEYTKKGDVIIEVEAL